MRVMVVVVMVKVIRKRVEVTNGSMRFPLEREIVVVYLNEHFIEICIPRSIHIERMDE